MKANDYIVIQAWMLDLGLTDKQLRAYAMIWGYSRDGRSVCRTTANELAKWLGCSPRTAQRITRQLEDMGLVSHEVVAVTARRGHAAGVMTDFWAVVPDEAVKPGKKARIDWAGRGKVTTPVTQPGYDTDVVRGNDTDVVTHIAVSRYSNIQSGGGKKRARDHARKKTTTTTTGFLFENNGSGLAPGNPEILRLPWTGTPFREAWAMLLRQPGWKGKTADALQVALDTLEMVCNGDEATYIVRLAVSKGWDSIKDPSAIISQDADIIPRYPSGTWEGAGDE